MKTTFPKSWVHFACWRESFSCIIRSNRVIGFKRARSFIKHGLNENAVLTVHKTFMRLPYPDSPRYSVCKAINEGDDVSPEIYTDHEAADLFQSEETDSMIRFLRVIK